MLNRLKYLLLSVLLTTIALTVLKRPIYLRTPTDSELLGASLELVRQCLIEKLTGLGPNTWSLLHSGITRCSQRYLKLPLHRIKSKTDKFFIVQNNASSSHGRDCVVVSIGIGNETVFEENLRTNYRSDCRFYGADPIEEMTQAFKQFGPTYTMAVDDSYGEKKLFLLSTDRKYLPRMAKTMPFNDFIDKKIPEKLIDYLAMDAEGSEYRIIPLITSKPPVTTVCQMALELHGPLKNYNMTTTKLESMLLNFLKETPYVPIVAFAPAMHHRFMVLNTHAKCLSRYDIKSRVPTK